MYNDGTATITNCTISDYTASGSGGGITNGNSWLRSTDCTLSGNSAAGGGRFANSGTADLLACTLHGNSANVGGAIDYVATATVVIEDTIVAANTGAGGAPTDIGGANAGTVTGTFNLVAPAAPAESAMLTATIDVGPRRRR